MPLANKFSEQSGARGAAAPRSGAVREISVGKEVQTKLKRSEEADGGKAEMPAPKPAPLDWPTLLEKVKATAAAGRSNMLAKSGHHLDGQTLTIYAGNKLAAAKLGDATFRPQLAQIIHELTGQELEIVIRPDKKPPENEQLAEIAAMMGGGEEVKLEDMS